jgi:hypothetical protein
VALCASIFVVFYYHIKRESLNAAHLFTIFWGVWHDHVHYWVSHCACSTVILLGELDCDIIIIIITTTTTTTTITITTTTITTTTTPWCRILFEKLIVTQLFKKYPAFLWNLKLRYRVPKSPLLDLS